MSPELQSSGPLQIPGVPEKLEEMPFLLTTVERVVNWAQRSAIWPVTFGLACCAIEMMAMSASR